MTDMLLLIMILAGVLLAAWWLQRRMSFSGDDTVDTTHAAVYHGSGSSWSASEDSSPTYDSADIDSSGDFGGDSGGSDD